MTKNFNVRKLERKKNEEIKGRIGSSSLIPVYTIYLSTVRVCTKFHSSRLHSSGKKCDENFYRVTESQNDGRTRQIQYSLLPPPFFQSEAINTNNFAYEQSKKKKKKKEKQMRQVPINHRYILMQYIFLSVWIVVYLHNCFIV